MGTHAAPRGIALIFKCRKDKGRIAPAFLVGALQEVLPGMISLLSGSGAEADGWPPCASCHFW